MKLRNKVVIICSMFLIILSLAILLFSCIFYKMRMNELEAKAKELREEQKEQIIKEYETKNQFIGINNCFLGMVTPDSEWISANDFRVEYSSFKLGENVKSNVIKDEITADDILNNKAFYLYDERKILGKKSDIFYDKDLNPEYYFEINVFRFNAIEYEKDSENRDIKFDNSLLFATSKLLANEYTQRIEVVDKDNVNDYEKYVKKVLDDKGIVADINIDKVLIADSNSDGNDEKYILANSINDIENELRTNNIKPIYSFVLKVENENVEIILERVMTEKDIKNVDNFECYYELDGLSLVDFDNDGKLEIVASGIVWDIPEIFVFKTNEASETELCLYGNFAW